MNRFPDLNIDESFGVEHREPHQPTIRRRNRDVILTLCGPAEGWRKELILNQGVWEEILKIAARQSCAVRSESLSRTQARDLANALREAMEKGQATSFDGDTYATAKLSAVLGMLEAGPVVIGYRRQT
jgi:hypothetical protein